MIDLAFAALACPASEETLVLVERTASDLKLGKPLYRKNASQDFHFYAALPGSFHAVTREYGWSPRTARYSAGESSGMVELVDSALDIIGTADPPCDTADLGLIADDYLCAMVRKTYVVDEKTIEMKGESFFSYRRGIEGGSTGSSAIGLEAELKESWSNKRIPKARVMLSGKDATGRQARSTFEGISGEQLDGELKGLDWTSFSIKGDWSELIPLAEPMRLIARGRDDLLCADLDLSVERIQFDECLPLWTESLGHPYSTFLRCPYPRKKWNPCVRPEELTEGQMLRLPLHRRERGAFVVQLDILHRPAGNPVLDLQVIDQSDKGRAATELKKTLAKSDLPYEIWDGNPWERWL